MFEIKAPFSISFPKTSRARPSSLSSPADRRQIETLEKAPNSSIPTIALPASQSAKLSVVHCWRTRVGLLVSQEYLRMGSGRGSCAKQNLNRGGASCVKSELGTQKKGRNLQGRNKAPTFASQQKDECKFELGIQTKGQNLQGRDKVPTLAIQQIRDSEDITDGRFPSPECKKRAKASPSPQHIRKPEIGESGLGLAGVAGKSFPEPQALSPEENFQEMRIPGIKLVQSIDKLKLQLFPMDDYTHKRLEKDGHNPYLELTLSARKKITSVLNHLKRKWGASSIASGELMLFPYNGQSEALTDYRRWTLKDTEISAADVYALVGSPALFRLRYCWFSNQNSGRQLLGESESVKYNLLLKEVQKENTDAEKKGEVNCPCEENRPVSIKETAETTDGMRASNASAHSFGAWSDYLTNISMGSLLGESVDANRCNPEAAKGDSCLRQISFSCDSFDAAIAAHISRYQNENVSVNVPQISVLDAENTCHAFPVKKLDHLREVVPPLRQNAFSEVNDKRASVEVDVTHGHPSQEHSLESELQVIGLDSLQNAPKLSDLSWNDSLGPFDLGLLSSSKQIISGDSVNLSSFFASSRDAL